MFRSIGYLTLAAGLFGAQATASAADIKVYSTIGVKSALEELAPRFEKATGHKVAITWGLISSLTKKAEAGEVPDVLIVAPAGIDSLSKAGKIAPGSGARLGVSQFAIGVKQGAPKPDIATVDAFKKALLAARAIGYTNPAAGGASGVYFAQVIERLGIADQIKAKSKFPPPAGFVGELLTRGEVDLAIQSKPELTTTPGVDVVGPFPGEFARSSSFAAGVGANAKDPAAANALVKFLSSPDGQAVFKAKGFDPA
jgi:molybdate transport system substrate-binding protein